MLFGVGVIIAGENITELEVRQYRSFLVRCGSFFSFCTAGGILIFQIPTHTVLLDVRCYRIFRAKPAPKNCTPKKYCKGLK